jgi:signal transduction histidine kinase
MPRWFRVLRPYIAVVAATVLVYLPPILGGPNILGALAVLPVIAGASLGGLAPGLVATALVLATATLLFSWRPDLGSARPNLNPFVSFIVVGAAISLLFQRLHAAVSEARRAEAARRDADRRKDQFLATLAHELRNPLAPISNALQVWPLVEDDRAETARLREMMDRQVRQMVRLIDDLLDVSRISRGKIELRKERVSLETILQSAVEAVRPLANSAGHQLSVVEPEKPLWLDGDVARLNQVFANLLHNAIKYTGRDGRISLVCKREGAEAVVSVGDNGPGIPPQKLNAIFEPFEQVDQTLDRSHGGLGIGLTLVKSLIELHGGSVEARSDGPGHGSEFVVRLPALAGGPEPPKATDDRQPDARPLPRRRVLVVDDVAASAGTLASMLESIGQEVQQQFDGPSAIAAAQRERPEIVFLDIAMPGMDGYQVARQMRATAELSGATLIALTGLGQEEDRRHAFEAGFDHHLVKPVSIETLRHVLGTVEG